MYSFPESHVFNHKINSDHIIEIVNLSLIFFWFHLDINFKFSLRHGKSYNFPVSWLYYWNITTVSFWNSFNLIPITFDLI